MFVAYLRRQLCRENGTINQTIAIQCPIHSVCCFYFEFFSLCIVGVFSTSKQCVVAVVDALTHKQPTKIYFISYDVDVDVVVVVIVLHYKHFYCSNYFFLLHFSICHHNSDHYSIFVIVVATTTATAAVSGGGGSAVQMNFNLFNVYVRSFELLFLYFQHFLPVFIALFLSFTFVSIWTYRLAVSGHMELILSNKIITKYLNIISFVVSF